MPNTDFTLVQFSKTGDRVAFGEIYSKYKEEVRDYLRHLIGTDADEVDDLVQDTFLKAYESFDQYNSESTLKTWLCAIAKHTVYNWKRDSNRRPPQHDVPLEEVLDEEAVTDEDFINLREQVFEAIKSEQTPELELMAKEMINEIFAEVEALPSIYQKLFDLRYIDQLSYEEICSVMDMPMGTVKKYLYDLNQVIQEIVESYNE